MQVAALGRQRPNDRLEALEHLALAAEHRAEADLEAPDAAGDAHVEPVEALRLQLGRVAARVVEVAVARVDDDVARLEDAGELLDERVGRVARGHADHDVAGGASISRSRSIGSATVTRPRSGLGRDLRGHRLRAVPRDDVVPAPAARRAIPAPILPSPAIATCMLLLLPSDR